jgi:hypothetical protein
VLLPLLLTGLVLGSVCYLLGWYAAENRERKAMRSIRGEYDKRINNLGKWVRQNWPDEAAAYRHGHTEGYQQGVLQASQLEADSETMNA